MVLGKLGDSLRESVRRIATAPYVDKKLIDQVSKEIQRALLRADVNVKLVFALTKKIKNRALTERPPRGTSNREHVIRIVYEELVALLGKRKEISLKRQVILMVGLYGQGKTTSCAKLARYFQKKGFSVGMIASDTHRPAAYEQLKQLGDKIKVPVFGKGKNPVKRVKDGLRKLKKDVVIIDTSGRHSLEKDLIKEMQSIAKAANARENILVLDATMGQQAMSQAQAFHRAIGVTSTLLTKIDGSAKGGGALSAVAETKAPVVFIGTGEKIEDLDRFEVQRFISRLLGMGDLQGLLEKAEEAIELKKAEKLSKRLISGKFTLKDMQEQMKMLGGMGALQKIIDMLPFGMSSKLRAVDMDQTQEKLKTFKVIMRSMTEEELENPGLLKSSRVKRIALGSGTEAKDVKALVKYYKMTKQMMRGFGKRGMRKKLMSQLKFAGM